MRVFSALLAALCLGSSLADYNETAANRYIYFSGAAYCCGVAFGAQSCRDWDCFACKGNLETIIIDNTTTQGRGYVGYDEDTGTVVVAFSGTDPLSIKDWIDDIDTVKVDYPGCDGCQVHKGFYKTYLSLQNQVHAAVEEFMSKYTVSSIEITGHSLGAALAQHCALDLAQSGYTISPVYNFGQPRTGNQDFTDYYSSMIPQTYRVTHHKDPVPHLPLQRWGFHHEPLEIFYNQRNTEYTECDGSGEDKHCADQYDVALNVEDHLSYLDFPLTESYLTCKL